MFEDTRPAELDATGESDPWAPFRVGSAGERLRVLRDLRNRGVPVMLYGPCGAALSTTLWTLDVEQQCLGFCVEASAPQLARLVEAVEVVAVAYNDNVKLQFDLHGLMCVRGATANILQCRLPDAVYRFQRRSAYRVRPPAHPVPVARFLHPEQPELVLALRILDVSIGGCALWLPDGVPPLHAGTRLDPMRCELDLETRFTVAATLPYVSSVNDEPETPPRYGALPVRGMRVGCEWQPSDGTAVRALQRWIDQAQRRRRLLTLS